MQATRVAVLGCGHWGPNLIRNLQSLSESRVQCVIDASAERLRTIESQFRGIPTSSNPADAFTDPNVDAVVIATPTETLFDLVQQALEAGKHVLCEKPLCVFRSKATSWWSWPNGTAKS